MMMVRLQALFKNGKNCLLTVTGNFIKHPKECDLARHKRRDQLTKDSLS